MPSSPSAKSDSARTSILRASCARHLPPWARLGPIDSGFHACIHLPPDLSDRAVVRTVRESGVLAISLSSGCIDQEHGNGLVIGFGAFDALTIDRSLAVIGRALKAAVRSESGLHQRAGEKR